MGIEPAPTETRPPIATVTPVEQIPVTDVTEALETPTETPSVPPTPSTPRPANEAGCTNKAMYVADVTIPDNTVSGAGETFTKTWRISNAGTCVWAWDYNLSYYSENRMGAPEVVPLDITYPGQTLDISVELTAPGSPGTYRGNFVIKNAEGLIMQVDEDSRLWLIIKVENTAPIATTAPTTNISPTKTSPGSTTDSSTTGGVTCSFATDVFKLTDAIEAINAYRAQNGLPAYTVNTLLATSAR